MTESTLKNRLGLFIIIAHFFVIILTIFLSLLGGFSSEEMTTTVALIIPMFSIYTTAIIKDIIANKTSASITTKKLSKDYVFVAFFVSGIFVFLLVSMILAKSFNFGFEDFEQFKIMLGLIQTAFGVYMGLIISSQFRVEGNSENERSQSGEG